MDPLPNLNIFREIAYPTPYAISPLLPLLLLSLASQKHSPTVKDKFQLEYDYIIVGAGSAGSVLARRLSEMPCVRVLLLEAGKPPPRLTDIPAIARSFINTDIDWQYMTTPQRYTGAGMKDRRVPWPSGKTLGGSSTLNAMLYVRGNRRNYDEWAEAGCAGWSYEDVLPYFKKLEDNTDPEYLASGFHGSGGPVTASKPEYNPEKKLGVMDAIRSEGFQFVDSNGPEQIGFFDHQASMRRGQRCSTAKAYLVPSENNSNLDILPNAMVRRVLISNNQASGVEFDFNGSTRRVRATREVILSAGTTNTAQLLMLSGIGPMSELKKHNISLVVDLPVGRNFQDHPAVIVPFEVDDRLPKFGQEIRSLSNIRDYINNRTGPLTSTEGMQLMSFLSNSDSNKDSIPDHSVYFGDFASQIFLQFGLKSEYMKKFVLPLGNKTIIACISQILHPHSIGSVSLQSADPYAPPVIDPNYFSDYRDIEDIVQGMKKCLKIMQNPVMKRLGAKPVDIPMPGCEEFIKNVDLYFRCIVQTIVFTTSHQVGTAKMGDPKDPTTVVDPELRVKGVRRLRVVDASVMPTIPWSNTNIPTIMIAEKASDIIKKTVKCRTK